MDGVREVVKRTASLRRRPGPQPSTPTHDAIFLQLYGSALQGVASQFEASGLPGHKPFHTEGDSELARARVLARRAWNLTCYAVSMFEEDYDRRDFNNSLLD